MRGGSWRHVRTATLAAGLAMLLVGLNVTQAAASTCSSGGGEDSSGHYYSGEDTNNTATSATQYDGLQGAITKDSLSVSSDTLDFNIQYLDNDTWAGDCGASYDNACWVQDGYGVGTVGGAEATSPEAYVESDYYGGYSAEFWPTVTLGSNSEFKNLLTADSESGGDYTCDGESGLGKFQTYVQESDGTWHALMLPWLDGFYCTEVEALSEAYVGSSSETCPSTPDYQYFGSNG